MTIGYPNPEYPVVRTILNKCEGVTYTRVRPFMILLRTGWNTPFLRLWSCRFWLYMPQMHEKCPTIHGLYKSFR